MIHIPYGRTTIEFDETGANVLTSRIDELKAEGDGLSIVKAAYEFRVAVEEGYGPDLSSCARCGRDAADKYYLDVMNGQLFCGQCRHHEEKSSEGSNDGTARIYLPIYPSALQALRYLESCDISRFLLFRLEKEEIPLFRNVCENYLLHHVEHSFESLVYLKSII